jgi:glycosyltransferase involved in cell wall biosynthesis
MKASLVLCTRNRAAQLERCLVSIARLNFERDRELILVDNGSTDDTGALIRDFAADVGFPVIPVYENRPGLGRARNAGLAAARGEIIVFTDDDCYPLHDFLDRVVEAFALPELGYLGGAIRLYDPSDAALTISYLTESRVLPPRRFLWPGLVQGANMAFRRAALDEIGGFDPGFGPGTPFVADDIDAAARASAAGWTGLFLAEAVVLHDHGRKASDAKRLLEIYDRGRGAYYAKLLLDAATRRPFAARILAELCRSALRRPRALGRELKGALDYLRSQGDAGAAAA